MKNILVTGAAGFIGFHVARRLAADGESVVGIDNLNDYYDPSLKALRLKQLESEPNFQFQKLDFTSAERIDRLFAEFEFTSVIHLGAQAGVRYSLSNPNAYIQSNLVGFTNILEACRRHKTPHLTYASSSSVYGLNSQSPFSSADPADHPVSLYAATKRANELMAHSYSHLFDLPTTGLRFFTVYGPWGRPDMSPMIFASAILEGRPIDVFNHGNMKRDFTYVDDIVEGVIRISRVIPAQQDDQSLNAFPDTGSAPFRVYNIGNNQPVQLMEFISTLEEKLGRTAEKVFKDMQPGDVLETCANVDPLAAAVGFRPSTPLNIGLERFAEWFIQYKAGKLESQSP